MQTPKLNVLTTFQELCLRSNLHKRAFRIPTIVESLSLGEVIAQEMSLEPTFQLMQREIHRVLHHPDHVMCLNSEPSKGRA